MEYWSTICPIIYLCFTIFWKCIYSTLIRIPSQTPPVNFCLYLYVIPNNECAVLS